jgi:hypothetical protein
MRLLTRAQFGGQWAGNWGRVSNGVPFLFNSYPLQFKEHLQIKREYSIRRLTAYARGNNFREYPVACAGTKGSSVSHKRSRKRKAGFGKSSQIRFIDVFKENYANIIILFSCDLRLKCYFAKLQVIWNTGSKAAVVLRL